MGVRILRIYHGGRDPTHRARDRALVAAGAHVDLVVPSRWPEDGAEDVLSLEPFRVIELAVRRAGDVNRHTYRDGVAIRQLIDEVRPDVVDLHAEPVSAAAHQWLRLIPVAVPVVMYSAQNIYKRFPPPFFAFERAALGRVAAFYPCSSQAAAVLRGKGARGWIEVLPIGYDPGTFVMGTQTLDAPEIVLMFVGRLVAEKGIGDAIRIFARVNRVRQARLVVSGRGPEEAEARSMVARLGLSDVIEFKGWQTAAELAASYRAAHVVLVPSKSTATWVEQFGRVITEAQASGAVVAAYESGAIPEVAGKASVLAPPADIERLAKGVAEVVIDPAKFEAMRQAGERLAMARTWDAVASRAMDLYRRVLDENTPGASRMSCESPRRKRARANAEFGASAQTLAGTRPFAFPLLRRGGAVARTLGSAIDVFREVAAQVRQTR